ncbi:hypothetical protein [Phaeocystidibacter luteus]|uniref:Uncharacterized protein n=1 Tax=Phaeocystidibacter luteus TaxID=911197 RepID=A0A6N6RDQ7_9FLAO|nr:hypothetical protein [Phaeocystidibacter luteus]KAB2807058.1 hypothetical protein F8C67_12755 [Phaeocystidibacter luteus]
MKFAVSLLFSLTFSFSLLAQSGEEVYAALPNVVTELEAQEVAQLLTEKSLTIAYTRDDSAVFTVEEVKDNYIRIKQTYISGRSGWLGYEVRTYEGEENTYVVVSRISGDGDKVWQRDFQLFEYDDDEIVGVAPAVRTEMLRHTVRGISRYMTNEYSLVVSLHPDKSETGYVYEVRDNRGENPTAEVKIKWSGRFFMPG